jgi:pimeloyl-ACP methyl ester carboxylesterase
MLLAKVRELRKAGYTDIVLVGHSAGGIVVRQFVEDHPHAGVTRVIQVCAPNEGATLAGLFFLAPREQQAFVQSLSPQARARALRLRAHKKLPASVPFVCVVGSGAKGSDTIVNWDSIWSADLQRQNVPCVKVDRHHLDVMYGPDSLGVLCRLIRKPQPRWTGAEVAQAKLALFGK